MLQVARLAPNLLGEAVEPVAAFLHASINRDGGARDRSGRSDLYYTVFLLESLIALRQDLPVDRVRPYLDRFGDGADLDLVHLTCLARCRAALASVAGAGGDDVSDTQRRLAERIESYRAADGGYAPTLGAARGTVYHGFLALGALQDLGATPADSDGLGRSVASLALDDGGFANRPDVPAGTTPTTAAAVTLLRQLGARVPTASVAWLLARARPDGGFQATPSAPLADLLSTATALHALAGLRISLAPLREATLDFLDTLWTGRAFTGNWMDDVADCEYTYYAMLSLGHLSLA
jgi:hypothetical protein